MSVARVLEPWAETDVTALANDMVEARVLRALDGAAQETLTPEGFIALLSPAAAPHLEAMARIAHQTTLRHFGRTIQLFTPLYVSNHCTNHCVYCGFNTKNRIPRAKLTMDEVAAEGEAIAATGLKHLLLLTGEAPTIAGVDYLLDCAQVLHPLFPSLSIEVFPMDTPDYARLVAGGVDGFTLFQETYDPVLYAELHPAGPKKVYSYRLDAPERAGAAGMRTLNIGALLGLSPWRDEVFRTALHIDYLQRAFPGADISVSLPRMRPHAGAYQPACVVSDRELVQILCALRLFAPRAGVTISTREPASLRDHLLPLGVTRMSAGVSTAVGGHRAAQEADKESVGQFEISDPRSVDEVCAMLRSHGYQPVFKDWEPFEADLRDYAQTSQENGRGVARA